MEPLSLSMVIKIGQCKVDLANYEDIKISGVGTLKDASPSDISFFHNTKYIQDLNDTNAGFIIIKDTYAKKIPKTSVALVSSDPYLSYAKIAASLYRKKRYDNLESHESRSNIHRTAVIMSGCNIDHTVKIESHVTIGHNVTIGKGSIIESGVKIGNDVTIGSDCVIRCNAVIEFAIIGNNCHIYPNACIGHSGFGYAPDRETNTIISIPQLGAIIIGNNVDIGSCSIIDRGSINDTIIGDNTKIAALVQVGHNTKIGKSCMIVSQVGIAGSVTIGNGVIIAGQVGINGHIEIEDNVKIMARAGVMSSISSNQIYGGAIVAVEEKEARRLITILHTLPKRWNAIQKLIKRAKNEEKISE